MKPTMPQTQTHAPIKTDLVVTFIWIVKEKLLAAEQKSVIALPVVFLNEQEGVPRAFSS